MTRKQKPTTASKKHAPAERKSVKVVAHKKPPIREKAHVKAAATKKTDTHHPAPVARAKSVDVKVESKAAAKPSVKAPVEKKMLGIERRSPIMPE